MATIEKKNSPRKGVSKSQQVQTTTEPASVVKKTEKRQYAPSDPIDCISITAGELGMTGLKSGISYRWAERGDVTEVEYQDIVAAIRSHKSFVVKPYFVIQDEDLIDEFPQLKKIYEKMYSLKDLEDVFRLPLGEMKKVILELPDGAKETIKHIAATKMTDGSLDSVKRIRIIDEIFNTELLSLTNL